MTDVRPRTGILALLDVASIKRRRQLNVVVLLTLLGTIAELVTISAVVPMLVVASDPVRATRIPVLGAVVSWLAEHTGTSAIVAAAILLAITATAATALRLALNRITQEFVYGFHKDLVIRIYAGMLRQPFSWYAGQNSSVMLAAVEKVYLITVGSVAPLVTALSSAFMVVMIATFLLVIDPAAALIAMGVVASVYLIMTIATRGVAHRISETESRVRSARLKTLQESLGGIRDIILDRSHAVFEAEIARLETDHSRLLARSSMISIAPRLVVEGAVIVLIAALSLWFSRQPGGMLHALPVLGALALGAQRLLPMVQIVYYGYVNHSFHRASLADVVALLHLPIPAEDRVESIGTARRFEHQIELADVSFAYDATRDAISDVSLSISRGERIGIIGATGCGKSTLADLVMGLLSPNRGTIRIDGEALSPDNATSWQTQIAHVPQAIFLSDDTIAANIAFGSAPNLIDEQRVADAAARAGLADLLDQLPEGLRTRIGERGIRLSGGQRQRIGIARALYRAATVLVLDEATSALDDTTEAAVMGAVEKLGGDLTIIVIAHRLSTLAGCDRIYRIAAGRIAEQGSYLEVVGRHASALAERAG